MIISIKMESLISLPDFIKREYDPFASPPNYQLALEHRKATLVGLFNSKIKNKLCECCMLPINKQPFELRCKDNQLSFLGTSLVMYFSLVKVSVLLLTVIGIPLLVLEGMVFNERFVCCQISSQLLISLNMRTSQSICFVLTGWLFFTGLAYLLKRYSQNEIYIIDKDHPNQEDYTLKLSNLPTSDQGEVKKMVQICLGQKVANLDLAFDVHQMQQAFLKRQQLTMIKNKMDEGKGKNGVGLFTAQTFTPLADSRKSHLTELNSQINRLDQILGKYKHYITYTPYKQIGVAFVSFETKSAAQQALKKYQTIITGKVKQNLTFKQKIITVQKAMNPKDVVWQHLNSENKKMNLFIQASAIVIGLIIIVVFGIWIKESKLREDFLSFYPKIVVFVVITLIYGFFHGVVHLLVSASTKINKYSTYTSKHMSNFKVYFLLNTLFTCALPFLLYRTEDQLIVLLNFVTLIDALVHPLIKIFNCKHIYQRVLGEYIKNLQLAKNYYTQDYLNRLMEGREFQLGENYHFYLRSLFVLAYFSFSAPLVFLYYILSLVLQYFAQKTLLLRTCKTPPKISKNLVELVITFIYHLPAVFLLGVITLQSLNGNHEAYYWFQMILLLLSLAFSQLFRIQCKKDFEKQSVFDEYYISKAKFAELYQAQNPIKKYDGTMYSSRSMPSQKIFSSPECREFQLLQQERNRKQANYPSQIRSINRLMSYNNQYFDLFISSEYKRLCDT